jgi:AcrR family transcriptional regulator
MLSAERDRQAKRFAELIKSSAKHPRVTEKKHKQIVEAACPVFFEKGYHLTTIRDISKACGMSMGQIYHYISSKDDVLFLVHKHFQGVWYELIERSHVEEVKDPVERLNKTFRHTIQMMLENRKLFQFLFTETKHLDREHRRVVLEMFEKNIIGFWRRLLKEANKKKSLKCDIDFSASLVSYLILFLALRTWSLRGKSTKHVELLIDFILRGLGL